MSRKFRELSKKVFPEETRKRNISSLRRVGKKYAERGLRARDFRAMVSTAVDILRRSGLEYMVTGGVALSLYGRVRTTMGIDIIVGHDEDKLRFFVDELNRAGFMIPWEWVEESLERKSHFTVQDKLSPYHLDVKVLQPAEKLEQTVDVKLYNRQARITTPEDLILHKLRFGNDLDVEDARSIIIQQKNALNLKYLLKKSSEYGLEKELIKLLREEGIKHG